MATKFVAAIDHGTTSTAGIPSLTSCGLAERTTGARRASALTSQRVPKPSTAWIITA
jgi:hypothetical protein